MNKIHEQLKKRRKELGLKQADMMLRVGMSRQQYQRLESRGNPRLDTLDLIAKGLKMEVMRTVRHSKQALPANLKNLHLKVKVKKKWVVFKPFQLSTEVNLPRLINLSVKSLFPFIRCFFFPHFLQ